MSEEVGSVECDQPVKLSDAQIARIERNRQRALQLRQSRLSRNKPYDTSKRDTKVQSSSTEKNSLNSGSSWLIDTGGGFLLEPEDEEELNKPVQLISEPAPVLGGEQLFCEECGREFTDSFLYKNYELLVCDRCRDAEGKHALITKSEAKKHYLLKDCDFDRREPPLKYILKKNPHNSQWGDMKLYIKSQVEARSYDIWGGEEGLENQREKLMENREEQKQKRFDKKVKELRKAVRTSTWKRDLSKHVHEYDEETYDEEADMYSKACKTCDHVLSFEKM